MEFEKIKAILAEQLGVVEEDITMESSLTDDLGADSLDLVELVMAMEEEFDVEIPDGDVEASLWGRMQQFSVKALDIAESIDWNKMIVNQHVAYTISKRPRASEYAS